MIRFARLFDAGQVTAMDEVVVRLADPDRLSPLPVVRPGVARHAGDVLIALVLEIVPLPFPATAAETRGGLPTFYLAPFDTAPPDDERITRGVTVASSGRAWIAVRLQDACTLAPYDWIRAIGALLPAAEQAGWLAQESVYGVRERLRVTDHAGAPLAGASFSVTLRRDVDLGIEDEWTRALDARSDLALAVADAPLDSPLGTFASLYAPPPGRHFAVRWTAAGTRAVTTGVQSFYPSGRPGLSAGSRP